MTISSGFFNSVNHDRLYDAEQFGSLFDGIINDGVYEHVGDAFEVTPNSDVNDSVIVGTGRAWFNHTWILNNAQYSITLNPPNLVAPRYDAIALDIDRRDSVRKNSIVVVEGTPASDPQYPSMVNEELHSQYPIAYIRMNPGNSDIISTSDITYNVGKSSCPLVTGPLEVINDDNFFSQMNASFTEFKNDLDQEFTTWFEGIKELIEDLNIGKINLVNSVDNVTIEWPEESKKLQVKDRGITRNKLSFDLQSIIGVLDPSGWSFQDFYDYTNSLTSSGEEETFTSQYITKTNVSDWTSAQVIQYYGILKSNNSKNSLWNALPFESNSPLYFRDILKTYGSGKYSSSIGKKATVDMGDTYGIHKFIVIGVNIDNLSSGGKALLTFQSEDVVAKQQFIFTSPDDTLRYSESPLGEFVSGLISHFPEDLQSGIKEVTKYEKTRGYSSPDRASANFKVWLASRDSLYSSAGTAGILEPVYDYYSGYDFNNVSFRADNRDAFGSVPNPDAKIAIKKYLGKNCRWVFRDGGGDSYYGLNDYGYDSYRAGSLPEHGGFKFSSSSPDDPVMGPYFGNTAGILPCFCV